MASQPKDEKGKSTCIFEENQKVAQTVRKTLACHNCSFRTPRFYPVEDEAHRTFRQDEDILVMQMVLDNDVDEPTSMQRLPCRLETINVEAEKIEVKSKSESQGVNEFEPFSKSRQGDSMGCFVTIAQSGRKSGNGERSQGFRKCQWIEGYKEGESWGNRCRSRLRGQRAAEDLYHQHERFGSYDQDSHREAHQERQRWSSGWSATCASEQSRCLEEISRQNPRKNQKCRSGVDEVQEHHEEEVSRTTGCLQRAEKDLGRTTPTESLRVPGCHARAKEESELRAESNGTGSAERGEADKAFAGGRALGNRGLGRGRARSRGEEVEKSSCGAFSSFQAEKSDLKNAVENENDAIAAPGPFFEAAAEHHELLKTVLERIGELSPYHEAFCLTLVCLGCFLYESVQQFWSYGLLGAVLAVGIFFGHCLFSVCREKPYRCRAFCCIGRRRYARRMFERSENAKIKHGIIFFLVIWHDIGTVCHAETFQAKEDATGSESRSFYEFSHRLFEEGSVRSREIFDYAKNMSASWTFGGGNVDLMALQRQVWDQRNEARQAAYERNEIIGEEEIVQEVTALNQHEEQQGLCLVTHAIRDVHEGTRKMRYDLQHGDDFLDLVFAIRQRWSDVISPFHLAVIIYVIPQPPPSSTSGQDCLHLIVDGKPSLGGSRNLVAMSFEYNDNTRSDVWFQVQRNLGDLSGGILLRNLRLESFCMSEAIVCTCRAGLTVFQEGVNYQNQDGLCATVQIELMPNGEDNDLSSFMTRIHVVNRLFAYIYRLGTEEPIYIQLSDLPENERLGHIRTVMTNRPGHAEQGTCFFHQLQEVPSDLQGRDIWPIIQEFASTQKEGQVIVMLDVDVYEQGIAPEARPSDGWREVTYVRKDTNRDNLLKDAELTIFCRRGESYCHVEENGRSWHENDETNRMLANGGYIKVSIQSQRADLPFCVQWEQAQRGVDLIDMVDTRRYRKRRRDQDEASSESSDSTTLIQIDMSVGRSFGLERRERLPHPGNGVGFEKEIKVIDDGKETRVFDRTTTNNFIADFCDTRQDDSLPCMFLDFVKKVRFKDIDETSSENQSEKDEVPRIMQLENHLPIQSSKETLEDLIVSLRRDPAARYPLRQDWESIGNLHPTVQNVLAAQSSLLTGSVIRMHIFLDGSAFCQRGKKRAAWSFVVGLEHDNANGPNCKIVGFAGAPLASTSLSSFFIGEEVCDSGEAECAAMYRAGIWLLSWGRKCMIETVIHGDNMPTVKASTAEWRCPTTPGRLFEKCRCLWQRIENEGFPISLKHLHGHKGHPGNEAADSVAKHFASTDELFTGKRTQLAKEIALHPGLERFWWFHNTRALPSFGSTRFFKQGKEASSTIHFENEPEETGNYNSVHLSLATLNVFSSLDKDARMVSRRRAIAKQADTLGWKVVALQETRFRMSIYKRDELFHMYTASATKAGFFGCELWLSKKWMIAGRKIHENDVHVLIEEPTMIAIALNHPSLKADFISVHAPQKHHHDQSEWWKKLHDFVKMREKKGRQAFILGDMNARVGSCFSNGIGRLFAQDECANGRCLRKLIDDCDLILPSTFAEFHEGSNYTFQMHRLDYVAIPSLWKSCIQRSEVATDFDMLHCKNDHQPLVVNLSFMIEENHEKEAAGYDKEQASDPKNSQAIEKIFSSFREPDWEESVDDHSWALATHVHEGLCKAFPKGNKRERPKQPYIEGHLWMLVQERKRLRIDMKRCKEQQRKIMLLKCWHTWRNDVQKRSEVETKEAMTIKYNAFLNEMFEDSSKRIQKMIKRDKLHCLQETLEKLELAFKTKNNKKIYDALKPYQQQNAKRKLKTPKPLPYLIGDHGVVENREEWQSAWETHWAQIEGASIKSWEKHQLDFVNTRVNMACSKKEILEATPTLLMVEQAVRGIKRGKAGGIDGICPDAVRLGGAQAAKCIFTLATKEMARGQVPLLDRGGLALPLYKHKGSQSSRSSFRSIVLENCVGKTISRMWRPELERAFKRLSSSAQGGAKKGMGPTTHILRLRVLQRRAFLLGESFGIVLLDMESAFYKAVRQLVVKSDDFEPTDEYAAHISKTLGIGPEEHKIFFQHLAAETMLERGDANRAVQKWILSSMEGSWCKLRDSARCLETSLGTKPGDPTADVLYSLVMTKFLQVSHQKLKEKQDLKDCARAMTWVDDVVLPFQECANGIYEKAGDILSILHNTATSMGMTPNLKRGKTEVILGFAGSGAQASKRDFEQMEPLICFETTRGKKTIEVVNEATYLGAILESKGRLMPEIVACTGRAFASIKPLRKAVLCNEKIQIGQRTAVIKSLSFSKSTYTIGSWMPMKVAEEKAWRTKTMKTIRLLFKERYDAERHMTDEEVLVRSGLLAPQEMITLATLRTCSMLAQWADDDYLEPFMDTLASNEGTWMVYAVSEINNLSKKVNTGWGVLNNFPEVIEALKGPKAQKDMNSHLKKYTRALLHERGQRWLIRQSHPKNGLGAQKEAEEEQEEFSCIPCKKIFRSKAALGVHNYKIHGNFCEAYSYAATSICYACLGQYFTRERLVRHLQWGTMDCLTQIKAMVEPLTKEQILFLNARDKEQYQGDKKQGKRHKDQARTFCREGISQISDVTGDWGEYFSRESLSELEVAEMEALEKWSIEGPILDLYEKLPDSEVLQEILHLIKKVGERIESAKVLILWMDLFQMDLNAAYTDGPARNESMAAWANVRSSLVNRFI